MSSWCPRADRPIGQLRRIDLGRHADRDRAPRPGVRRRGGRATPGDPRTGRRRHLHRPRRRRAGARAPRRRRLPADRRALAGDRRAGALGADERGVERQADPAAGRLVGAAQRRALGAALARADGRHVRDALGPRHHLEGLHRPAQPAAGAQPSTPSW
ncbi:hypothetical protein [Nocardioides convexus]|uniref:hypothetical protein n=1 Tax=Nocardioides convexus TaxID=2712224 RepID=UPI0024188651|nr:hypothetical protein [Nocardioides convexus]